MTESKILERLTDVFAEVLKTDRLNLSSVTTAKDVDGWDSLTHVELLNRVEEVFGLTFTFDEVIRFSNVGDMIAVIQKRATR